MQMFKGILITEDGAQLVGDINDNLDLFISITEGLSSELKTIRKKNMDVKLKELLKSLSKDEIIALMKSKKEIE